MAAEKKIVIIAGPNGAGKTTFAREFLPNESGCPIFVNADLIAAGLSPFAPDLAQVRAGRLMLAEIREHADLGVSFAFETTLSGRSYAQRIPSWQADGYHIKLVYLGLPDVQLALKRVATRVSHGGHNVPEEVVRRRFVASRRNFDQIYKSLVNIWIEYDNSHTPAIVLNECNNDDRTTPPTTR
ncbi:MAG: zeta toxin family protein [Planctomycetia bacterium]|nr:zeta toxin family protein [Planctomycetia bacterium]